MAFILNLITNFFTDISDSIDTFIKTQEKKINISKLSLITSSYSLSFLMSFLLGNATEMSAIIFKDALGDLGLIFPKSSSIVLYWISLISLKNMFFYSKETKFYKRELEESIFGKTNMQ